jgi:hypothetical protein
MRFDTAPTFFNLGYASKDTSDNEVKQENKAASGDDNTDANGDDASKEHSDSEVKQENKADANGEEESSDSNSQEQQNKCSNSEELNEETGKCEESKDDGNSEIQVESIDSSDPDLCLKIDMQIARSTQAERELITVPPQCLASKTKETDSTQNSEEQIEFPKIKDSSSDSDSNSDSKKSSSKEDTDKSDSKGKNQEPDCLVDSTPTLAALGQIAINQCSGSSGDKNKETDSTLLPKEQEDFERGYLEGFQAVLEVASPDTLVRDLQLMFHHSDNPSFMIGVLNGVDAGLVYRAEKEVMLQKDTLRALGVEPLKSTNSEREAAEALGFLPHLFN